ncbi:MAG: TerC/Alx family metal homeostasis membrane protein [Bacteroidia bacterium]|nr:TerC/Alx family metal homeostasis membrane protein [Bacteroidia bacterium]
MNYNEILFFSGFILFIILILYADLGLIGRKSHVVSFKEASLWSVVWISLSLIFWITLRYYGHVIHGIDNYDELQQKVIQNSHPITLVAGNFAESLSIYNNNLSLEYITGYLIEYALSIDNVFVMVMIFYSFSVKEKFYKRVLFWGILGAIVMRFLFIFLSAALIQKFNWTLYIFGGLLIFTAVKMFLNRNKEEKIDTEKHPVVRFASKYFNVFPRYVGQNFFIRRKKVLQMTPLFLVLLVIEFSDVIFAVDSVPAIFSITKDPYIVFFSNIFAILGLRSLFFLVVHVINLFHYLKTGLSFLLAFIGTKMFLHSWLKEIGFTTEHSLYVVLGILVISILASVIFPPKKSEEIHLE